MSDLTVEDVVGFQIETLLPLIFALAIHIGGSVTCTSAVCGYVKVENSYANSLEWHMKEGPLFFLFQSTIKITVIMMLAYKSVLLDLLFCFEFWLSSKLFALSVLAFSDLSFKILCYYVCLFSFTLSFVWVYTADLEVSLISKVHVQSFTESLLWWVVLENFTFILFAFGSENHGFSCKPNSL